MLFFDLWVIVIVVIENRDESWEIKRKMQKNGTGRGNEKVEWTELEEKTRKREYEERKGRRKEAAKEQ